ncbi:MAG: aldo/keto reductase [Planctomycetota bacterium]
MWYRRLRALDTDLSAVGFGGIVLTRRPQDECNRHVAEVIDAGITYFDVAPQYGNAQELMGPALEPYRDRVTLACKTLERTAEGAAYELEDSLKKLRTDRFDIYQLHSMTTAEDVDTALGPGGALEAIEAARDAGKVRAIGFSAHGENAALRLIETGRFQTMLYPLNFTMFDAGVFGPRALEAATAQGMDVLALKAMARGQAAESGEDRPYEKCWYAPEDRPDVAVRLLRYTLHLPGVVAALPPGQPELFQIAMDHLDELDRPLTDDESLSLREAMHGHEPLFA